jgi:hypothetical protein
VHAPDGQHAADVARRAQREHDRGADVAHHAAGGRGGAIVGGEVGGRHRLPGGQHLPRQRLAGREHQAARGVRAFARGVADDQPAPVLVGQREHGQVGAGQLHRMPGNVGQHLAGLGAGQQPGGDLGAGLDPALLAAGRLVQPRVLHRHAGRGAQRDQHRLVVLGELPAAALVGQVQVAEHFVPDPHRDAEEAAHRRVPVREARRCRVPGDVGQAQRPRIIDQQAEQAVALRPVMDLADFLLAQADRDELGEPASLADHAQRAVRRVHQADRGLHDPPQGGLQVQTRADRDNRLQQAAHPVPGAQHDLQPGLQLGEQLVQLQGRQQLWVARTRFHEVPSRRLPPGDDARSA